MVQNKDVYNNIHLINDGLKQNNKDEWKLHLKRLFKIRSKDTSILSSFDIFSKRI